MSPCPYGRNASPNACRRRSGGTLESSIQEDPSRARRIEVLPAAGDTLRIAALTPFTDDHCDSAGTEFNVVSEREVRGVVRVVVRLDHVIQIPPVILVPVDVHGAGARLAWIQRRRARPGPEPVVPLIANRQDCPVAADRDALAKEAALGIVPPGTWCQHDVLLVDAVFPLEHV